MITCALNFLNLIVSKEKNSLSVHCRVLTRVSVQGVKSLWGDCMFIPADWGS